MAGDIVVTLFQSTQPLPETLTGVRGCATDVDADLLEEIADSPGDYYVNVHNVEFPGGAIRGQLQRD